ncbi:MAG: hypothetical protein FJ044_01690 [Candidatus Cloacimonetes bacterium]|nr:hypothetical protein [Candidatus Cloacimonadota bacterium]
MVEKYEAVEAEFSVMPFVEAAEEYGIEGLGCHVEGDREVLEQKVGEGWPGLGYDGKNLWMGLTHEAHVENQRWNANTILDRGREYKGILTGEEGVITGDHPLAKLFAAWCEGNPNTEIHITGVHAGWQRSESTRLSPDKEGNLHGNIPTGVEIKVVITDFDAKWDDGKWRIGETQRLEVAPASAWDLS